MADTSLIFVIEAQDRATEQLKRVESALTTLNNKTNQTNENSKALGKSTVDLTGAMGGLGKMVAWVGGMSAFTLFLKDSTEAAGEDSRALIILQSRLKSIGTDWGEQKSKIEKYTDKMITLGIAGSDTATGLGKLVTKTDDVDSAMELSTLAADLAASGYGTYAENVDNLSKILSGRGSFALRDYGIKMDESATAAEMLTAVQDNVTISAQTMSEEAVGNIDDMGKRWNEFQGQAGKIGLWFENELADAFNYFYDNNKENIKEAIRQTAYFLEFTKQSTSTVWDYWKIGAATIGINLKKAVNDATAGINSEEDTKRLQEDNQKMQDTIDSWVSKMKNEALPTYEEFKTKWDNLFEGDKTKKDKTNIDIAKAAAKAAAGEIAKANEDAAKKSQEAWDKATEKIKNDFTSFSSKVLGEVDKQQDAILKLKESMMSAQEKYNTEFDKIMGDKSLSGIENSAAREVALKNAKNEYDLETSGILDKETEAQRQLLLMAVKASDPNLTKQLAKESSTFLYDIGQSPLQQQFTFNFAGDVNDKDKFIQLIIDALNRQSSLLKVK